MSILILDSIDLPVNGVCDFTLSNLIAKFELQRLVTF